MTRILGHKSVCFVNMEISRIFYTLNISSSSSINILTYIRRDKLILRSMKTWLHPLLSLKTQMTHVVDPLLPGSEGPIYLKQTTRRPGDTRIWGISGHGNDTFCPEYFGLVPQQIFLHLKQITCIQYIKNRTLSHRITTHVLFVNLWTFPGCKHGDFLLVECNVWSVSTIIIQITFFYDNAVRMSRRQAITKANDGPDMQEHTRPISNNNNTW